MSYCVYLCVLGNILHNRPNFPAAVATVFPFYHTMKKKIPIFFIYYSVVLLARYVLAHVTTSIKATQTFVLRQLICVFREMNTYRHSDGLMYCVCFHGVYKNIPKSFVHFFLVIFLRLEKEIAAQAIIPFCVCSIAVIIIIIGDNSMHT